MQHTTIVPQGKYIAYDRETEDYAAYYDGQLLGYRATYAQAEQLADEHAYRVLRHQQEQTPSC